SQAGNSGHTPTIHTGFRQNQHPSDEPGEYSRREDVEQTLGAAQPQLLHPFVSSSSGLSECACRASQSPSIISGAPQVSSCRSPAPGLEDSRDAHQYFRVCRGVVQLVDQRLDFSFSGESLGDQRTWNPLHRDRGHQFPIAFKMGGLNYFELNIFYSGLTQHSRQFRTDVRVATSSTYDFLIKFRISLVRVTVRVTEATVEVDVLDRHPTT